MKKIKLNQFTSLKLIQTLEQGVKCVQILIIKTQERHYWRRSAVFIVKFEHIFTSFCSANFEHVVAG